MSYSCNILASGWVPGHDESEKLDQFNSQARALSIGLKLGTYRMQWLKYESVKKIVALYWD
jgi:hypothetical protein